MSLPVIASEQIDPTGDSIQKMRQRFNNRLLFPLTELPKRYIRGDLEICLLCNNGPVNFYVVMCMNDNGSCDRESHSHVEPGDNQNQVVMLINTVQFMNDGERIVGRLRSMARLELIDKAKRIGIGDPLYLSAVTGNRIFIPRLPFSDDGKSNLPLIGKPVSIAGKHPSDMVEARPEMMDNLSSNHAETRGDFAVCPKLKQFLDSISVFIAGGAVWASIQEGIDLGIEIEDILIGPV